MNATVFPVAIERPDLRSALRLWLGSTALVLRAVGSTIWNGLYAVTKARLLVEQGRRRPTRRL